MSSEKRHPIQVVAAQTGLTQHAIRAWERRYGAVQPARTPTNRRMYSDDDIARLRLLLRATQEGRSVGQVAQLPTDELRDLLRDVPRTVVARRNRIDGPPTPETFLANAVQAVEELNGEKLEAALAEAETSLSQVRVIEDVVLPLIEEVGDRWRIGTLRVAHEHLASSVVRGFLTTMRVGMRAPEHAPVVVFATPAAQWHELGALMAAAAAGLEGWRVTYLGPNLPAEEIAAAALTVDAKVVALSIVYPEDDPLLGHELRKLRKLLGPEVLILAGGRAASAYLPVLQQVDAVHTPDLKCLRQELLQARRPATTQ